MPSPTQITVSQLARLIGTPDCPVLIDVSIDADAVRFNGVDIGVPQGSANELSGQQTLAIRPEAISLTADVDNKQGLQGRIVLQRQVGALIEREIDVDGSIIRQTEFQNTAQALENGAEVALSWDWSQVWVLPQ